MSLTRCPDCRHLSFVDALSCPTCLRAFRPGALRAQAAAEERSFRIKYGTIYLAVVLTMVALLLFVALRGGAGPVSTVS
jgi:hypothetical protein